MINIYPANQLENLSLLLSKVLDTPEKDVFSSDLIITQSQGMRHWLNMQLAEMNGVSMNIEFQLPIQFFWTQLRNILGNETIPEKSAFSREVLCWKIYDFLAEDDFKNDPLCKEATDYWTKGDTESELKRFQLARMQADLFEQYLIYRPDWISNWEKNEIPSEHVWQAKLWLKIVRHQKNHTVKLIQMATPLLLAGNVDINVPKSLCIFGINALPPIWMDFLTALSSYTNVHLFHLNPCVEYWGDLQSEKQLAKWLASENNVEDGFSGDLGNPLLANLGMQGREFLSLLPEESLNEIPVFDAPANYGSTENTDTVLHRIQEDILNLEDAREINNGEYTLIDDSIVISSSHSPLREIQGLHDYLLRQFNKNKQLKPKDIVVMCPQIEQYAPYIEAVFGQKIETANNTLEYIPCTISDRTLKNVEPIVEIFEQLLLLPDSRFQLSEIISYLRLPAIAHKFNIEEHEITKIEQWLQQASVHWGINKFHKQAIVQGENNTDDETPFTDKFTWQQGLDRLILGFAYSDHEEVYNNKLLMPSIEGSESELLGKLMLMLEQLSDHANKLNKLRTPMEWHEYLTELRESIFAITRDTQIGVDIVSQAIDQLGLNTFEAEFETEISLKVVRDFLSSHFSQPEPGHQFMTGQVTFCSMVPMRSIPFKVVCILGLNDGDFPRFDTPISFDLIANGKGRRGDRSRRGDDRYLFLEALISVRDMLYLSYQGHSVKDNAVREPSIILSELMNYLELGYGWSFDKNKANNIIQLPLQPFSLKNYQDKASFDKKWLALSQPVKRNNSDFVSDSKTSRNTELVTVESLVHFFADPLKAFSRDRFGLFLSKEQSIHEDFEPFASNELDKYKVRHDYVDALLSEESTGSVKNKALLRGTLPDTEMSTAELASWELHSLEFYENIDVLSDVEKVTHDIQLNDLTISGQLALHADGENQYFYRMASPKGKDYILLWLHHLLGNCINPLTTTGIYFQEKVIKERIKKIVFPPMEKENAYNLLTALIATWEQGMETPLFIPAELGKEYFACDAKGNPKGFSPAKFENMWSNNPNLQCYYDDPIVRFYFDDMPDFSDTIEPLLDSVYRPLFSFLNNKLL